MRHLLDTKTLAREDALRILDVAEDMADTQQREVKKLPTLRGKTVMTLFYEASTRTRISFEPAGKRLCADVINFSANAPACRKASRSRTRRRRWRRWIRTRSSSVTPPGAPAPSRRAGVAAGVVTPATARMSTRRRRSSMRSRSASAGSATTAVAAISPGWKVTIVGDILHSRVARSNVWLLDTLGAHVTLVAPPTLVPNDVSAWPVRVLLRPRRGDRRRARRAHDAADPARAHGRRVFPH